MAWIELHQSLIRHPKVLRVAEALGVSRVAVVGHLAALWCWALDAKPDGGPLTDLDLRTGAEWTGRKDFTAALASAGLVDERDDGYWLHDWSDYAGRLVRQRTMARDRARSARAASPQRARTVREQFAPTQPNPTEQNPTRDPDQNPPTPRKRGVRSSEVDSDFREVLAGEFPEWKRDVLDSKIDAALGHKQAQRYHDMRAYVRNWLKTDRSRDAERIAPSRTYASQFKAGDPSKPTPINHGVYDHLVNRGA